jgi:HPt (histidine-containing phosphotransfer) domain-containing protein
MTTENKAPTPRYSSEFANDPEMKELIAGYVQRLPVEIATLRTMLENGEIESLRRVAHQLKGSGGGYGFSRLTELAAIVDRSIKEGDTLDRVRREIDALVRYAREIHGYKMDLEVCDAAKRSDH